MSAADFIRKQRRSHSVVRLRPKRCRRCRFATALHGDGWLPYAGLAGVRWLVRLVIEASLRSKGTLGRHLQRRFKGVAGVPGVPYSGSVNTITAVLEADPDGTVHLPVPEALRNAKLSVTATICVVSGPDGIPTREEALAALRKLRELGTFNAISDPVAWQREIRKDRPLPGRD